MGFLNMLGLMRVEDHNRIVAKQDAVIDLAASHMKGEDFDGVTDHAGRVSLVMARLRAARTRYEKAVKDLAGQVDEVESLRFDIESARNSADRDDDTITGLRGEIASLRPDAEKFRAKAARDAEQKKAKRAAAKKATTA